MSRLSKTLSLMVVIAFLLACNFVTQPFQDAQNAVETVQSVASQIPFETLQAIPSVLPSVIPEGTLEALPSLVPTFEAAATEFAPTFDAAATDFGNTLDPQGTPVAEWKGVPVMPQAVAGQEFSASNTYSFRVSATGKEIQDFYNRELTALGWSQPVELPIAEDGGFLFYEKDGSVLTIFITPSEGSMVVLLTMG